MEWYYIVLIVLGSMILLFLILDFAIAIYLNKIMVHPHQYTLQEVLDYTFKQNKLTKEEYETGFNYQHFDFKSKYGYNLKATFIEKRIDKKFLDGKERVVILVHGWTSNRYAMLTYAKIYLKLGFHVYVYDHRNHHESDKEITSMGDYEANDLQTLVELVKERFNNNLVLGTHGESMGSATVMIHAGRYKSVDFVVEDCGYSTLYDLLKYQCKDLKHLPIFPTLNFAHLCFKITTKSNYNKVRPIDGVKECDDIPMYFIHGANDDFVPTRMVNDLYEAKKNYRKLTIYENSLHAMSIGDHFDKYSENIEEFLKEIKVIA